MSDKKPFDAAISLFQEAVKQTRLGDFDTDHFIAEKHGLYRLGLISQAELAIHFLKAAGKVNKTRAIQGLKNMENIGDFFPNEWSVPLGFEELLSQNKESAKEIRALLESLPEKEEK